MYEYLYIIVIRVLFQSSKFTLFCKGILDQKKKKDENNNLNLFLKNLSVVFFFEKLKIRQITLLHTHFRGERPFSL